MNKHEIQARIDIINNEMIQTKANYAKLEGHLDEARHWMAQAMKKEEQAQMENDKEHLNVEVNNEATEQPASESVCGAEAA
jgi:hypothetical protein